MPPASSAYDRNMSRRIDKSWLVYVSVETQEHDRCVDFFARPDGTYGFETFRRDPEDGGAWTPLSYHSAAAFPSAADAVRAAEAAVPWLADRFARDPALRALTSSYVLPGIDPPQD